MAQLSPTNLLYAQALEIISNLRQDYAAKKYKTPNDIVEIINTALTEFETSAGKTLTKYDPVMHSEVPDSDKINRLWTSLQADVNILQSQIDILRASAIFTHNFIKTEINQSKLETEKLLSKLKTLELYSNVDDDSLVYFGDNFISNEFVDESSTPADKKVTLFGHGSVGLGIKNVETGLDLTSKIQILPGSNGFPGNNQEILDPTNAGVNPLTGDKVYVFASEINNPSNISLVIDNQPNTWFEFEKYYISPTFRNLAKNYNFHYQNIDSSAFEYINSDGVFNTNNKGWIDWADGLGGTDGVLTLNLEIDLGSTKLINYVKLTPYGLLNNVNNPIKIKRVLYSEDGNFWGIAGPENVIVANSIDRRLSITNSEIITINEAIWVLKDATKVRYFRFEIEQPDPILSKIGHLFYLNKNYQNARTSSLPVNVTLPIPPDEVTYDDDLYYDNPAYDVYDVSSENQNNSYSSGSGGSQNTQTTYSQEIKNLLKFRELGPVPPVNDPMKYIDSEYVNSGDLVQKREYFDGLRWAIGIRDIELNSYSFRQTGFFVTNKFNISGVIDRVALDAEVEIPEGFDQNVNWIKFYISPDNGITWYQISRIQDDFLEIPEIIAFNDPTPVDLRDAGVSYIDTTSSVSSLRLKVEFTRPDDEEFLTPILKSYKLKIKKRT
jgi:thiol-disulfide isomerase/thioredoxin